MSFLRCGNLKTTILQSIFNSILNLMTLPARSDISVARIPTKMNRVPKGRHVEVLIPSGLFAKYTLSATRYVALQLIMVYIQTLLLTGRPSGQCHYVKD